MSYNKGGICLSINTINVVLADDNKEFTEILFEYLSSQPDISVVGIARDGREALKIISQEQVEVLILDIIMPYIDGLGVLDKLSGLTLDNKPSVIVLSSLGNDNYTKKALELGADYYIVKPFGLDMLTTRIREIAASKNKIVSTESKNTPSVKDEQIQINSIKTNQIQSVQSIQKGLRLDEISGKINSAYTLEIEITRIMREIGIPANIKGYQYLRDSIMMAVDDMESVRTITKILYPNIAKRFKSTSSRVERAIRHAIEVAWTRGKTEVLEEMFGFTVNQNKGKPTNSEFIAQIAERLRLAQPYEKRI